jgi:hypothetical protein
VRAPKRSGASTTFFLWCSLCSHVLASLACCFARTSLCPRHPPPPHP